MKLARKYNLYKEEPKIFFFFLVLSQQFEF